MKPHQQKVARAARAWMAVAFLALPAFGAPRPLFDGKTLAGWETSDTALWRVEDGAIVAGNGRDKIPRNTFIFSKESFRDFEFRCEFKLTGDPKTGMINSGIQFRSERMGNGQPKGYQADMGDPAWWGGIYDEHRRNKLLIASNMEDLNKVLKRDDWNEYVIRCEGARSRLWINGLLTSDYVEKDVGIPKSGRFAFQLHSGGAAKMSFRNITIETFEVPESPLTPAQQLKTFTVPEGFEVELVASEETGVAKPITVAFDAACRMWTITALEYPVDANESPAESNALWKNGGRDKVLVVDAPHTPGPHTPRVFAEGLAMPMGVLPYKDGVIVGQGPRVLWIRDTNKDGRADQTDVLLSGFGVQDSHLMPHQFTHLPGGWVLLAQGAFNRSQVGAGDRPPVRFDFCKIGRFRLDRPLFEIAGTGLNNIWGFILDREGNQYVQEANDHGFSVAPFETGTNYPGIGNDRSKPYAPFAPPPNAFRMGGTGLSGLALAEDRAGSFPADWNGTAFVANPITRMINAVRVETDAEGRMATTRLPDFLSSSDEWFRPIAITFGPDGCLYIVDWYNKIISHNEVPRKHRDRDRSRGRIWRVRHADQPRIIPPNLAATPTAQLPDHLNSDSTWAQKAAWQELVQRGDTSVAPQLVRLVSDESLPADTRIHALWVLDALAAVPPTLPASLFTHPNRNLRREAAALRSLFVPHSFAEDSDPTVRGQAIRTLARHESPSNDILRELLKYGREEIPLDPKNPRPSYERAFERYLVRAALERHPAALAALLDGAESASISPEHVLFAVQALPKAEGSKRFVRALPRLKRPLSDEEISSLLEASADSALLPEIVRHVSEPVRAAELLQAALRLRDRLGGKNIAAPLDAAITALASSAAHRDLIVEISLAFAPPVAGPFLHGLLADAGTPEATTLQALHALGRLGGFEPLITFAEAPSTPLPLAANALGAAASSAHTPDRRARLLSALARVDAASFDSLISGFASSQNGARVLLDALESGRLQREQLSIDNVLRMGELLPDDEAMAALMRDMRAHMVIALHLGGKAQDHAAVNITLPPSFTVETWILLNPGISNADGILGRPGAADFNFFNEKLHVYAGAAVGNLAIARTAMVPSVWTHLAVTRNHANGILRIFLNGVEDAASVPEAAKNVREAAFSDLHIGLTTPSTAGTDGVLLEYRVWDRARTAEEITRDMHVTFRDDTALPPGLAHYFPEGGKEPKGGAAFKPANSFPRLRTGVEAEAFAAKFSRMRTLAQQTGSVEKGKVLFTALCMSCHTLAGQGVNTAPPLDGSGHRELDSLIMAILDPDAAIEPGYRVFKITTHNGELVEGYLAQETDAGYTMRFMGGAERHYPRANVKSAGYLPRSFMPAGLVDNFPDEQVRDLFTYIRSLREP